jgi:hypothetical protein
MAVNVYMVFFFAASPTSFVRYLWLYCLICFGLPFIPAISLLILNHYRRGEDGAYLYFGNATVRSSATTARFSPGSCQSLIRGLSSCRLMKTEN